MKRMTVLAIVTWNFIAQIAAPELIPKQLVSKRRASLQRKNWTRDELLVCFNLYCRIPFGKFHSRNPEIIAAAKPLQRTPSAVAMKLVNFASLDPAHQKRHVRGLRNTSNSDRALWEEFESDPNKLAAESETAFRQISPNRIPIDEEEVVLPAGPSEKITSQTMRLVQSFFRNTVLASYEYKCSFCKLRIKSLLNASHIIPWKASVPLRADPRNGLCLCVLHDRAFDRGLIAVDSKYCILISKQLKTGATTPVHRAAFLELEGIRIDLPKRFLPAPSSLEHHLNAIFIPE